MEGQKQTPTPTPPYSSPRNPATCPGLPAAPWGFCPRLQAPLDHRGLCCVPGGPGRRPFGPHILDGGVVGIDATYSPEQGDSGRPQSLGGGRGCQEPTPATWSFLSIFLQLQLHTRLGQSHELSTSGLRGHLGQCFSKRVPRNTGPIRCSW